MDQSFLTRVRRTTIALTILGFLAGVVVRGLPFGLALLLGSAWSVVNLLWLEALGRVLLAGLSGKRPGLLDLAWVLGGLPMLVLGGFAILASGLSPGGAILGFSLLYTVVVLKTLGLLLARGLDYGSRRPEGPREVLRRPLPSRRTLGLVGWGILAALAGGLVLLAAATSELETEARHAAAGEESAAAGPAEGVPSGEEAHEAAAPHGAATRGEEGHEGPPHLPTAVGLLHALFPGVTLFSFLYEWEDAFFSALALVLLAGLVHLAFRRPQLVPGRGQAMVEIVGQGIRDFMRDTFGAHMVRFVPFCGSLFLYILVMNWMGLVPLLKSPTANLNTTLAMAILVFLFAQFMAIRTQGLGGYLYHLAGEPRNALGWGVALLLFPIEVMGEFIKPLSLACRLFGNVLAEDLLIAVFVGIGALILAWQPVPVGFPIQVLFVALALVMGAVQALVFALLAAVYLYMAQPIHGEEHHGAEVVGAQPAHA
jgi:F-type H+-transporting ATPase subunit a